MERLLNPEDRIRRAEEIYERRQSLRNKTKRATVCVNSEKKNFRLFKKLALQIIICVLIYCIFYLINTTNYSFSEITLSKTNEIISYDINFANLYNMLLDKFNHLLNNNQDEKQESGENTENSVDNQDSQENSQETNQENNQETNTNTLGLETNVNEESTDQENTTSVEESLTDKIKKEYSFIVPVNRNCYF